MMCESGPAWHEEWGAVRIASAMNRQRPRFRTPLLISLSIIVMATADVSSALLIAPVRAAYRSLREARGRQAAPAPSPAAPHADSAGQAQDDPVKLRHRSEITNPYHVEFRDVTNAAGIHFHHERASSPQRLYPETMGAGVAWIDYNQDGYLDAFFVNSGYTPNYHPLLPPQPALYRNNRDGTFTDVTAQSKIHTDGTMFFGVAVGDYDNDGFPDIYMTGYRHSVLLHNNGDGTFTDVTAKAGVANDGNWGTAAGWFAYDHDGKVDLLVTNYVQYDADHPVACGENKPGYRAYCHPDSFHGTSMRLYHNNGDGTFSDMTAKAGLVNTDGKSLGVVLADLNGDGWPDIFIANDTQRNFLYLNNGDGTFRDASYKSGAGFSEDGRPEAGMSADAADVMNNGLLYLF